MIASALTQPDAAIQQVIQGDRNQVIGHVSGGTVIYVSGDYAQPEPRPRTLPIRLAPRPFPSLLGRQREVKLATDTLPYCQPLEYYGSSGIGKTVLLRHLAHHPAIATAFPAGLIYLRHQCYQSASDLLQVLYESFYESPVATKPTRESIRQALAGRQSLVLLDESALPKEQVQQLVEDLPDLTFVFAAAERQLWGEGQSLGLVGLSVEASIALIARELNRPLTTAEQGAAAKIANALDGHPLQLLQAVALAQKEGRSLTVLAQQLHQPKDLLAFLHRPQRLVLTLLAMLAGAALAAEQIAEIVKIPAILPILDDLRRNHWIELTDAGYRATGALAMDAETLVFLRDCTIDCLSQQVIEQGGIVAGLATAEALYRSLGWAIETNRWQAAATLAKALERTFALSGQWDAWGHTLQGLLQAALAVGDRALEGYALHQLGTRALCLNELSLAQTYLEQAREIRTAINDPDLEITQQNLDYLNAPAPLPAPLTPSVKPSPLPRGRMLLWGGLAAVVGLLGVKVWGTQRSLSLGEPARVIPIGLEKIRALVPPAFQVESSPSPTVRLCTDNRLTAASVSAQVVALSLQKTRVSPGEIVRGSAQLNCIASDAGLNLDIALGQQARQRLGKASISSGSNRGTFAIQIPADYPSGEVDVFVSHADVKGLSTRLEVIGGLGPTPTPTPTPTSTPTPASTPTPTPTSTPTPTPTPVPTECDRALALYRQGAIAGNQLIQMSLQNKAEVDWGKTVNVTLALKCPSSAEGSTVQLSSNDDYLVQNLPLSIEVSSDTSSFSFQIPTDGYNYPQGGQVSITATYGDHHGVLLIDIPPFAEPLQSPGPD